MNSIQLEMFVLELLDRVRSGKKVEDARVELKRDWPNDHARAARQLAALANAARSDWVLLLIGIDELGRFSPNDHVETNQWLAQVGKHFEDGVAPRLLHDLRITHNGQQLVALLFASDRAPYVWVVPPDERRKGVDREVPWRRGTEAQSAHREDLLRLLSPLISVPQIELVHARLELRPHTPGDYYRWSLNLSAFIVPTTMGTVVLPSHKISAHMTWAGREAPRKLGPRLQQDNHQFPPWGGVTTSPSDITARAPGTFYLLFYEEVPDHLEEPPSGDISVEVAFGLMGNRPSVRLEFTCLRNGLSGQSALWEVASR